MLSNLRFVCWCENATEEYSDDLSCAQAGEFDSAEEDHPVSVADEIAEIMVPTKVTDGPPPATLATQKLLLALMNERKINRNQVLDLLNETSLHARGGADIVAHPREPLDDLPEHPIVEQPPTPAPSCAALPAEVLARLHSLAERIDARGRASLLPCTTRVGRAFLPAIRFLASCIPAAGAPETKTAQGGPAHVSAV